MSYSFDNEGCLSGRSAIGLWVLALAAAAYDEEKAWEVMPHFIDNNERLWNKGVEAYNAVI